MSLLAINLDGGQTDAGLSLAPFGSLFDQSGVLKTGAFDVSALGSPGMAVEVSGSDDDDYAIIKTGDGSTYFIKNTIVEQVTILANSSGVTKTDAIVLYVDLTDGDPDNSGSPGAASLIAVRRGGVSTGAPTDGEIDAATSNNPWLKLREATVEHGATEIEDTDLGYSPTIAYIDGEILEPASVTAAKVDTGQLLRLQDNTQNYKVQFKTESVFCATAPGDNAFTITLPTAFSNNTYKVVATIVSSSFSQNHSVRVTSKTAADFAIMVNLPLGTTATVGIDWIAIGY